MCIYLSIFNLQRFHKDLGISPDSSSTGVIQTSVLLEQSQQQLLVKGSCFPNQTVCLPPELRWNY